MNGTHHRLRNITFRTALGFSKIVYGGIYQNNIFLQVTGTVNSMNHDYTHCLAADSICPKGCFRFKLPMKLSEMYYPSPVTWSNFEETEECKRKKKGVKSMNDDTISRQWLMECVEEGWIKFDTQEDENRFVHLIGDIAPSAQPETCEGCKHLGKWENEVEYGYPSPCTRCKRRVGDHYER